MESSQPIETVVYQSSMQFWSAQQQTMAVMMVLCPRSLHFQAFPCTDMVHSLSYPILCLILASHCHII